MILEMRFDNYKMFKSENVLSFSADTRIKKLGSNYFSLLNRNVLKSIGLYGQNNIGKSNVLHLTKLIKDLMLGVENISFNRNIFGDSARSDISITFKTSADINWMKYSFTYDSFKHEIIKEALDEVVFYETGNFSIKNVYSRDREKEILVILGIDKSDLLKLLPSKKPFLYCVSLDNDVFASLKPYLKSFKSFADSLEIIQLFNIPIEKTIDVLKGKDENKKKFIVDFIKHADLSIQDFHYNEKAIFKGKNNEIIDEEVLKKIDIIDQFRLFTKYDGAEVPSIIFDSTGTKKIEAIASYIYETIINGKTLIIDELDNGLHFKLSRAILATFNSFANTKGQLLFTAHDIELISCKHMMRKDQIYFSFRNDDLTSKLFCLKDAPVAEGGPRTAEDLLRHYNRSEFGYVPSPNFVKYLSSLNKE
ncbi:MAG TPA: ATP-binding protein [Bacilli bacterium]|nr:ATP-binding protein [Bacilli bacterium]